ncbi:MAG: outer membrane protein assembly factor BamA [Candidatus Aminicenantes bacterium]|nr:outer membrane protein assembly factor BamA [Candidatus Aminicenantes bacterium]
MFKKALLSAIFLFFPIILFGQDIIEKIKIVGNTRVPQETIRYYLFMKEGGTFNRDVLRKDFRVLWSTGFFSNIKIEEEQGIEGKIVKVSVEENPVIRNITYKTGRKLKEDEIVKKLKEKKEYILPYSFYSPYKIRLINKTVEELLVEKGLYSGEVKVVVNEKEKSRVDIIFEIKEGKKVRVGEIVFEGEAKLPSSALRKAMTENKKHGIISWIKQKDVFRPDKLDEDLAEIKHKLHEYGYMKATVGEPRIEEITKSSIFLKKQKMKKIIIPINAGSRYMVGEVKIEGNKVFSKEALSRFIRFKKGEVYSAKIREESVEEIGKHYRHKGYLYARIIPAESLDSERKTVNVTFNIDEGELAYLNRLEFRANTFTKDKVIRREMLIREGDRFDFGLFEDSILKMGQHGIVGLGREPQIERNPDKSAQIDVTLHVRELHESYYLFSGGYNGYGGIFGAFNYSNVNFLGTGKILELTIDHGERIKNYKFGFFEPYFLDYPINVGFNAYYHDIIFPDLYDRRGKGADLTISARFKKFWRASLIYSFENVNVKLPEEDSGEEADPVYSDMLGLGEHDVSSIMPAFSRSTLDSPIFPKRGSLYSASCKFAGSFLGGDISLIRPWFEWCIFHPLVGNNFVGFHIEYQFIEAIGDSQLPFWERFYLGGERSIRGYGAYSIGPRSELGTNIGGEKSIVFNAEYVMPVGGPLYAVLFYDAGNAFSSDQKISLKDMYSSAGLEIRIYSSSLPIPVRLILAYNNRKIDIEDSNFVFRFTFGTTF